MSVVVSVDNLESVFQEFSSEVLGESTDMGNKTQIMVFMSVLGNSENVFLSDRKNVLSVNGVEYKIKSSDAFDDFGHKYDVKNYSAENLSLISSFADSLIVEADRRLSGDFWTPKIWVDKAHEVISDELGDDWRDNYVVWDSAAGALNLTRGYKFKELFSSTLFSEELGIAEVYNPEATKFQYDFLNDDIDLHSFTKEDFERDDSLFTAFKVPEKLLRAMFNNEPLIFFSNPPYGTVNNSTKIGGKSIADNAIRQHMISNGGRGAAEREMYTQFIYRVQLFARMFNYDKDFHFFFFNKCFLSTPTYGKFTENLTSEFTFKRGFMINGREFNGTAGAWSVIFSHFEIGGKSQREFPFEVLKTNRKGEIEKFTDWTAYRPDEKDNISLWLREIPLDNVDNDAPFTKNGFDNPTTPIKCKARENSIGYAHSHGTSLQYSERGVGMYTMTFSGGQGHPITKENLTRSAIIFSIRRSVHEDVSRKRQLWVKDKDVFLRPSDNLLTPEFTTDCMIYSLFNKQSNQTSLRNYQFNGKTYRINNEFFPFSKKFIENLAIKHNNTKIIEDIAQEKQEKERILYNYLQKNQKYISQEAQELLNMARFLIEESFSLRDEFEKEKPRYQTNSWDAGWLQINRMIFAKDRHNDSFLHLQEEWKEKVLILGDKIAQSAYNDGIISPPITQNNIYKENPTHKVSQKLKELANTQPNTEKKENNNTIEDNTPHEITQPSLFDLVA